MSFLGVVQAFVAVLLSVVLTAASSLFFHGEVRSDFVLTGIFAAMIINAVIWFWSQRLQRANQRLRDEVSARTAELQIARAAASVAHEVKNPLTAVVGNLELAEEALSQPLGPEALAELGQSVRSALLAARHLHALVGDLAPGSAAVVLGPVDVDGAARAAAHIAAPRIEPVGSVEVALPALPPVLGNRSRLVQVLLNLLINAALASREGVPNHIRIAAAVDGDRVHVTVSDTGRGMAPDIVARVFEAGFTTRRETGGSGLGMAIVKDLVESAGGEVRLESEPGVGTTVHLWLRAARGEQR